MSLKFLNHKGWHTQSIQNQEKVFHARAKDAERRKAEENRAAELKQELEREKMHSLAAGGTPASMREKGGQLCFMYEPPPGLVSQEEAAVQPQEKKRSELTAVDKFPGLSDAPMQEGQNRSSLVHPASIKPLGIEIRDVKCVRCGQWGHYTGDPECPMRAKTVEEETFRQVIEDPLMLYDSSAGSAVTERLVLRHAIDGIHGGKVASACNEILLSDDEQDTGSAGMCLSKAERKTAKKRLKELKKSMKKSKKDKKKQKRRSSGSSSDSEGGHESGARAEARDFRPGDRSRERGRSWSRHGDDGDLRHDKERGKDQRREHRGRRDDHRGRSMDRDDTRRDADRDRDRHRGRDRR